MSFRIAPRLAHLAVLLLAVLLLAVLSAARAIAGEPTGPATIVPAEKDRNRHEEFLKIAQAGNIDLLFLGDSITDGWRGGGKPVWDQFFAPLKAANFGIGGDRTEHVLWRLRHGELDGIAPKLLVLMIGTNNGEAAGDVALGIKTIIAEIQLRSPATRILLLGIFPRGEKPGGARVRNDAVNGLISAYADGRRIVYQDIGQAFLQPDGTLPADIMPDFLHPNEKGYRIWAAQIIDTVKQLMQDDPGHLVPVFARPSAAPKVAAAEALIASGKVGAGTAVLNKLVEDRNAPTADAAKQSLSVVDAWKSRIDAQIAQLESDGDVWLACELATGMAAGFTGDAAKAYQAQAAGFRKLPAYAAGKEFQKLKAVPFAQRKDPRFAGMVAGFVKKYPDGAYAAQAKALVPAE